MIAGRQFRDNTAVLGVEVDLAEDGMRNNAAIWGIDRHGRLVARSLNAEDKHCRAA